MALTKTGKPMYSSPDTKPFRDSVTKWKKAIGHKMSIKITDILRIMNSSNFIVLVQDA